MKKSLEKRYALKFISGKYQGGEFALPENGEITIGRSSELDMVLVEDMVSRRHAKIGVKGGQVMIEDFGSTNGSFVNGERITKCLLSEGDRILIGTSIIKLVEASADSVESQNELSSVANEPLATRTVEVRTISGSIAELSLPDLLQLFAASRKNGILFVKKDKQTAKIYLREGAVISAKFEGDETIPSMRVVMEVLKWRDGTFELIPTETKNVQQDIEMSTEGLLMECMRLLDELGRIEADLPPPDATLQLNLPVAEPLSKLAPQELDVLQLALNLGQMNNILLQSPYGDVETSQHLHKLISQGYLKIQ